MFWIISIFLVFYAYYNYNYEVKVFEEDPTTEITFVLCEFSYNSAQSCIENVLITSMCE